jgi:uncharacterized protein (TIGR00369 family)
LLEEGWTPHRDSRWFDLVGPLLVRRDERGTLRLAILADDRHLNPNGAANGGFLLSFADTALALAVLEGNPDRQQATVQLDTSFIGAIAAGDLVEAECEVVHRTGAMAFARGTFRVGGRQVGSATGIWRIFKRG